MNMAIGSDYICVWIEDAVVHVGVKRIYDYEKNSGYIVRQFWERNDESKHEANSLAVEVSESAGLPLKSHWNDAR